MFYGEHYRKIQGKKIILPKKFFSGIVKKQKKDKCLQIIPQSQEKILFLSKDEIKHAKIKKDIVILGCGNYFEIWSPKNLEKLKETKQEKQLSKMIIEIMAD